MLSTKEGITMKMLTDSMGEIEARLHNIPGMLTRKPPMSAQPKEMNEYIYQPSLKPSFGAFKSLIWGSTFTINLHSMSTPLMSLYSHPLSPPNREHLLTGTPTLGKAEPSLRPVLRFA